MKIKSLLEIANPEVQTSIAKIWKFIFKAQFQEAFKITDRLLKSYPNDFLVKRMYAMLLADSSEGMSFKKRKARKEEACRIFRSLLRTPLGDPPKGIPLRDYYTVRNELYFHSGQWDKQAKLGEKYAKIHPSGAYSICVGYAWRAARYHCSGNDYMAKKFARKSLEGEAAAIKAYPNYYNLILHLALAAGIVEGINTAKKYLAKSQKLSGRPANHHEFEEILEVLSKRKLRDAY